MRRMSEGPVGAMLIGLLAGSVCYFACGIIKKRLKVDDALDVFAVHGVGGAIGILLTAVFADAALGGIGYADGMTMGSQFAAQATGLGAVLLWSLLLSFFITKVVRAVVGLRVNGETEEQGLDLRLHGERAVEHSETAGNRLANRRVGHSS